jgi:hypothetical protein
MSSNSVILIDEKVFEDDDLCSQVYTGELNLSMYSLFRGFEKKETPLDEDFQGSRLSE